MPAYARSSVRRKLFSGLTIALLVTTALSFDSAARPALEAVNANQSAFERAERDRIQQHLARVEARLRARAPAGLTAAQRRARAVQLDRLAAYRRAGVFPHNHDFAGRRIPYFVDARGTRCAMAYLIEAAGGANIVRTVHTVANNARVVELAAMPAVGAALAAALGPMGLTLEEAQAIQPEYGYRLYRHDEATSNHVRIAAYSGMACIATTILNILGPRSNTERMAATAIGAVAGGTSIAVGMAHLDDGGDAATLGIIGTCIGGLAIVTAGARLLHDGAEVRRSGNARIRSMEEVRPSLELASSVRYPLGVRLSF
jgi:hypothetical protein